MTTTNIVTMPIANSVRGSQLHIDNPCLAPELEIVRDQKLESKQVSKVDDTECVQPIVPPRPRKSVSWNEEVYVQETKHINDMDDDEVDATWYSVSCCCWSVEWEVSLPPFSTFFSLHLSIRD